MSNNTVTARNIARILSRQTLTEIGADTELIESGILDSVGVVRLLTEVEEHFGVSRSIDELGIEDIRSIAALAARVDLEMMRAVQSEAEPEALPRSACQA